MNISRYKILLSIVLLGFTIYFNSLDGEFIRDDIFLIRNNTYIKSWTNLPQIFIKNIAEGGGRKWFSYRPIQMITYMADYSIWGLDVAGYHLSNILLHISSSIALFWFINILFKDIRLSLLASLFFVSHPVHTEAVSFISGRADPLASLFILVGLILYIKGYKSALLLYPIAILSRENALIFPLLLLLYHYSFRIKINKRIFLLYICLTFAYILLRFTLLSTLLPHISIPTTFAQRIPGFFSAMTDYIKIIILPINLHMDYGNKIFHLKNLKVLSGIIILCILLLYAVKLRKRNRFFSFSILWFLITLLPSSNLYPLNAYMAEHWLYIPSIGFFILLAKGLMTLYDTKRYRNLSSFLSIILISLYSSLTIHQNKYWDNPVTFYERTLIYTPDDPDVYNNLGAAYNAQGRREEAIRLFKKALKINPNCADIYFNMGVAYYDSGKSDESVSAYKKALELNPEDIQIYINLGNVYRDLDMPNEGVASYKKALEIDPNNADIYNNMGAIFHQIGDYENAESQYKKAIEIDPDYAITHINLAKLYYVKRQFNLSIEHCDTAVKLGYAVEEELLDALEPYRQSKGHGT